MLATCASNRLIDLRDQAGGRRQSEIAGLRVEDLTDEEPVFADRKGKNSLPLSCLTIHLGRTLN
ncbi:hypothetical protein ASD02_22235 [Ensifer sp. Root1252]|nr:hypothetical protein ASD02_22235 [Ensifer sp. Root1252]KRC54453.1 hypothetical protein ASE32_23415 [Ensifer sp. Root231]KRD01789.1 hypothetical protein ASE47_22795 [Ensifer sp. Root258]OMQ39785.1 hypothetical protein BKP54_31080 [Ensifer sp. 1H6]